VDDRVPIAGMNEFRVLDRSATEVSARRRIRRNDNRRVCFRRLNRMKDDVFLQDLVIPEGFVSRIKYVHSAKTHVSQKVPAKRLEIGTVAETPWGNRNHLSARSQQARGDGHKARVQVGRLQSDRTKQRAFPGLRADLAVGRVQDDAVETLTLARSEEITSKTIGTGLEEISVYKSRLKGDSSVRASMSTPI
jgi:hypothetical protein